MSNNSLNIIPTSKGVIDKGYPSKILIPIFSECPQTPHPHRFPIFPGNDSRFKIQISSSQNRNNIHKIDILN